MKRELLRIITSTAITISTCVISASAQITLIGDNTPHGVVADGDFNEIWSNWRSGTHPPFWRMYQSKSDGIDRNGDAIMGLYFGRMYGAAPLIIADSKPLDQSMLYQIPHQGDTLRWEFGADLEYASYGTISVGLLFGEVEKSLAERVKLIGSDGICEHFAGRYTLTAADAAAGLPSIRVRFEADDAIRVLLDYINIYVERDNLTGAELSGEATGESEITLRWSDTRAGDGQPFNIYRTEINPLNKRQKITYRLLSTTEASHYIDRDVIAGRPYTYLVTRSATVKSSPESGRSNRVTISTKDSIAPLAPQGVEVVEYDTEVTIKWHKNSENDISHYSIKRYDERSKQNVAVCEKSTKTTFDDIVIPKSVDCQYQIYAHDHSGNISPPSEPIKARVKAIEGSSFSDLIRPMPITTPLTNKTWGAEGVVPRDITNGIESPDWSYWGGRPVKGADGKYHMVVTRWSESASRGHWEWPNSTVAQTISDTPLGPYKVTREIAYNYRNGLGHNPDIILLNDGSYALYSLVAWKPLIFTSKSMSGEWELLGEINIDMSEAQKIYESIAKLKTTYQFERNLSGVQLEDGSILMVTKFGAMMKSEDGLLGIYRVLTPPIKENMTIPIRHRNINYEDPVMWRDSVQFHLIINGFIDKRAIYLRSGDGINWEYEMGLAYTKDFTTYEDGTVNHWDKLERPHVIQDEYGRATHLSLAVIDIDKDIDYGADNHNSKNLIIPLQPTTLLTLMNNEAVDSSTREITLRIRAEEGFDPHRDIDLSSLRFGASRVVNLGEGYRVKSQRRRGRDLDVTFTGSDSGIRDDDFALKLIGRRGDGTLMVGYTKLSNR